MENGLVNKDDRQLVVSRSWHWNLICTRPWSNNQLTVRFSLHSNMLTWVCPVLTPVQYRYSHSMLIRVYNSYHNPYHMYVYCIRKSTYEFRVLFSRLSLHSICRQFSFWVQKVQFENAISRQSLARIYMLHLICLSVCM